MRVSVSLRSRYSFADPRRGAQAMLERTRAARDVGLDALYLGDHHSVPHGYYQNNAILGRLLAEWDGTTGALYLLPLWNPVLLAEQVGTLASVASGRFIIQCGLGGGREQFEAMGVALDSRVRRFEAALDIVRRLLDGEEVTHGDPFDVAGAHISPVPIEPVEFWLAGQAAPAIDRAARIADGWVGPPGVSIDQAIVLAESYRRACSGHGREPGTIAIRRDIHVGGDHGDADRIRQQALDSGYRGFDPAVLAIGHADEVIEQLMPLANAGVDEVVIRHLADDEDNALASFARLAEVRAALGR